jgi:dihydroxyacetone synthase
MVHWTNSSLTLPSISFDLFLDDFRPVVQPGQDDEVAWNKLCSAAYPAKHAELQQCLSSNLPEGWKQDLPPKSSLPTASQATRKSSCIAVQVFIPKYPWLAVRT